MIKILVIEDEVALQLLLEYDLKSDNHIVEVCGDGKIGLEKLQKEYFDVAIIDWMLPSLSGYDIIKNIRETNQDLKIVMVTARDDEMDIVRGLEIGADDYLTKPFSSRELNARIKALFRTSKHNKKKNIISGDLDINIDKREVLLNNEKIGLSKIEFNILVYLIENKNIVLTRDDILSNVWDDDDIDNRVVDVHISALKRKLKLKDKIISKRGVGYTYVE